MAGKKDLSRFDVSDYERSSLEYVLEADTKRKQGFTEIPVVSVEHAVRGESLYEATASRNVVRALFISSDETLLNPTQQSLDGFIQLSDLFDEVHVLILREGIPTTHPVLRVAKNVWMYIATARHWWWTPIAGLQMIHEQLVFVGGLRPDVIVARDPFESALVAYLAGKRYGRPVQMHILEDYTNDRFLKVQPRNRWRRLLARYLVPRFPSVRTNTHALEEVLAKRHVIDDLATLPRFNNYEALLQQQKGSIDLKDIYKQFVFFILYIGRLEHESTFYRVLDASRSFLRNPRVGLIVLGDGAARKDFEKRASLLGVTAQVVFETRSVDIPAYLAAAHVLVVSDTDSDADDVALQGAAAGIPLILTRTVFRDDVFVHGDSALLCSPESVEAMQECLSQILNDVALRRRLAVTAQACIKERFHDDPETYRRAYRASIERVLFLGEAGGDPVTAPSV